MAQLGARLHGMQEVEGSSPSGSILHKSHRIFGLRHPPNVRWSGSNDTRNVYVIRLGSQELLHENPQVPQTTSQVGCHQSIDDFFDVGRVQIWFFRSSSDPGDPRPSTSARRPSIGAGRAAQRAPREARRARRDPAILPEVAQVDSSESRCVPNRPSMVACRRSTVV